MQRRYRMTVLVMLLLGISMGYALLTSNLNILGVAGILNPTWDIHFENVQVKSGSVTAPTPTIDTNKTTVSYSVTLNTPGDFYEFTVDAVNAGTIDGMITEISSTLNNVEIEDNLPPALEYSITYEDGVELAENQILSAGDYETYKVRVGYKTDIDPEDLPDIEQTLNLTLTVTYQQADDNSEEINHRTLYSVLKKEATSNGLAREYTGAHHDSFTEEPSKKIYHWYAENDTEGAQALDKNNVIFANHCWQMIRTTDTGGVKMIYNGEVENGQCLDMRGKHLGYFLSINTQNLGHSNYYYGTDYTYDSNNKTFKISGITEQVTWNATTAPNLIGRYTCMKTTADETCSNLYLVDSYKDSLSGYVRTLQSYSNYSQFGEVKYNDQDSPAYVGYMYNTAYLNSRKRMIITESMLASTSLANTYWYAHNAVWGNPTANKYNLDTPYQVSGTTDYLNLVGEFTFRNNNEAYTNTSVYYIAAVNGSSMYYIQLSDEGNHTLSDFNYTYTYGESYTENGNGTYTINNPITINRSDWYTNYNSMKNKYVCKNAVNNTCSDLWYTVETTNKELTYIKSADNYKYAKSFTWDGSKYILDNDTSTSFWNYYDTTNQSKINNAHYTCWNETGECSIISYIYYLQTAGMILEHINLSNGKSVEDAINEMFYDYEVNSIDSSIKIGIDAWYKHFMLDYDEYIEDTIFCNDRSILSLGGWNPNGGSIAEFLKFKGYNVNNDLSCPNVTDQFSKSNNNAKLTYKVGLMSWPEEIILKRAKDQKTNYWLSSPAYFINYNAGVCQGNGSGSDVHNNRSLRPTISLKPGITYSSGTGSMANPYVVDTSNN